MFGRKSLPNKAKRRQTINDKTYNWCKWHNIWVEHEPEGKGDNRFLCRKKLDEEQKPDIQGYALKSILIKLNQ